MNKNSQTKTSTNLPQISLNEITIDEYYDSQSFLTKEDREHRKQGAKQLRDQLSSLRWYGDREKINGEIFWVRLYENQLRNEHEIT